MPTPRLMVLAVGLLTGLATTTAAQDTGRQSLYPKLQFEAAGASVRLNANIRVAGSSGSGTDIDAEDDLGLEKAKFQPRFAARWRPGRRHELELGYQFARRNGNKVLERRVEIGDSVFDVGAQLLTRMDTDQLFLNYRFAFMAKERTQVGASLGLGAILINTEFKGTISAGQGSATRTVGANLPGPTGSLGLFGRFLAGTNWTFGADARAMALTVSGIEATIIELGGLARYHLSPKLALEGGYALTGVEVDISKDASLPGEDITVSGRIEYSIQTFRLGFVWTP